ncbi:MAG TPA: helix-turn-helix domain-containing protein [Bacteroidales bacterium]|nr:helix-turn-helix domain-containing protein [Bacteroidales bacterium]
MTSEERIKKQKELVEEIGIYFDKEGFQPIAGRVLGLLMVMDKEQFTFDEIVEELQISKSSASNILRNLEIRGDIEYITLPGDRKRYFQLKRKEAFSIIEDMEKKMIRSKELFNYALELKADKSSKNALFFNELLKMVDLLLENFEQYKKEYKK